MQYDYSRLSGKIYEKYNTKKAFANAWGITETTLHYKLTNVYPFSQRDIEDCCRLLEIRRNNIPAYFFTPKVSKKETERS